MALGLRTPFVLLQFHLLCSRVWPVLPFPVAPLQCNCLMPFGLSFLCPFGFCVLSLLFLLFKYAAVFSMTTNLTEGPETRFLLLDFSPFLARFSRPLCLPIFFFAASLSWATFSAFSHYRNACYLLLALFFPKPSTVCVFASLFPAAFACFYGIN